MFFMYMRNVLALLMADTEGRTTLLDVSRVMWDKLFRNHLLKQCQDPTVVEFWKDIATQAQGDASLKEIAPYITNKFTEFTQNAMVKRIVGQSRTSFDFREAMDKQQIVLVNLSKGLLNDMDSRFLGMLLTGKLFRQAAGRASVATEQRVPFHVYIDEFQNLTSDALTSALAESRKYGLALTLAHQDTAQVSPQLMTSLMTNAATKLVFRVGPSQGRFAALHHANQKCCGGMHGRDTSIAPRSDGCAVSPAVLFANDRHRIHDSSESMDTSSATTCHREESNSTNSRAGPGSSESR
jgi:hypothetical protein